MKLNIKQTRVVLGITMLISFVALAYQLSFLLQAAFNFNQWYIALAVLLPFFWYLWVPTVILIVLLYFILTRVFKYKETD